MPSHLRGAGHVLVDAGDDMRTLTLSLDLLIALAAANPRTLRARGRAEWIVVVKEVALADHFAEKVRELGRGRNMVLPDLHYLDPERLAVRHFMASHLTVPDGRTGPRQDRAHVLIVGFGAIGRHLAEMSLMTAFRRYAAQHPPSRRWSRIQMPSVAVFSPAARHWLAQADIAFLDIDGLGDLQLAATPAATALIEREETSPFTVAFLASPDAQVSVRSALLIDDIYRKSGRLGCPLYKLRGKLRGRGVPDGDCVRAERDRLGICNLRSPGPMCSPRISASRSRATALRRPFMSATRPRGPQPAGTSCQKACGEPTATRPTTGEPSRTRLA